ncbi:hypothetical protein GCM10009616_37580 [Microlunatus lacustris]
MPPLLRWQTDFPPVTDARLSAVGAAGARLVYADDTWMYGRVDGPMTPQTPDRPVSSRERGPLADRRQHLRGRPAGPVAHWFGDTDVPITPTFVDDFARTLAAVGT